jgi:hypothetical protein
VGQGDGVDGGEEADTGSGEMDMRMCDCEGGTVIVGLMGRIDLGLDKGEEGQDWE